MAVNVRSALIAGVIAAVIYAVIALATDAGGNWVLFAMLLGVFTFAVSWAISTFFGSRRRV